jgi:hypothetical protein
VRTFGLLLATLGACVPMTARVGSPREVPAPADQFEGTVPLRVDFEPPLAEPGVLFVEHECGLRLQVVTGRSGVDLQLPPGPASLRLEAEGQEWAMPTVVGVAREVVMSRSR